MYFANLWGLAALLAVPLIVVIHMYQRRFPPLVVAGAHLWSSEVRQSLAGRRRENPPVSASLLLELLAALVLALLLADPHAGAAARSTHLVAVIDNSASMQAWSPEAGNKSFREAAIAELEKRAAELPRGSVVSLILTGPRPTLLAGPAVAWREAREKLAGWRPNLPRHAFEPAWDLGLQLIDASGQLLFVSDHLPPETSAFGRLECVAVGRSLDNLAIGAARWNHDPASGAGQVYVRVQNHGRRPATCDVVGRRSGREIFRKAVSVREYEAASFETDVPGGLGLLSLELANARDALEIDNRANLVEPQSRSVRVAVDLPQENASRLLKRVLDVLPATQLTDTSTANLAFGAAGEEFEPGGARWWFGIGPISADESALSLAKDLIGPFLLDKRNPLVEGVTLDGVIWGGAQPVNRDVTPIIGTTQLPLLSKLNLAHATGYLMNIDFARSNLAESPDWPILIANLVELRRADLPGLMRWNYRLGEDIRFRLYEGDIDPSGGGELQLVHAGKSRTLARTPVVELSAPDAPGVYDVQDNSKTIGRFAVNFQDSEESNLLALGSGHREPKLVSTESTVILDKPFSWLIIVGLATIVAALYADWFLLARNS